MERVNANPDQLVFIQSRAETNYTLVDEYAEMMRAGVEFDPAQGIRDESGQIFVWDGLHRGEAARQAGIWLWVEVQPGGKQKAEWLALTANQKHGLRRSRADLQRVVRLALLYPQGAGLSDREIARHCGVDNKTIGRIRAELQATEEIPQSTSRTGADGRTINTTNIGKRPILTLRTDFPAAILVSSQRESQNNGAAGTDDTSLNAGQLLTTLKMGGSERSNNGQDPTCQGEDLLVTVRQALDIPTPHRSTQVPEAAHYVQHEVLCPRCGERTVKLNGRALCLNDQCGTQWETAAAFRQELFQQEAANGLSPLEQALFGRICATIDRVLDEGLAGELKLRIIEDLKQV
ncbi:MAG: hypothetical protein HC875_40260 [Anaerolineales bacterium]|nr:hypothetical protein [Anaerolineales bacterium]